MADAAKRGWAGWALIGKILLVLNMLGAAFVVWDKVGWKKPAVVVLARHCGFEVPATFRTEAKTFYDDLDRESLIKALSGGDVAEREKWGREVAEYIRGKVPNGVVGLYGQGTLFRLRSVWEFEVNNEGEAEVKDLVLEVPFSGICRVVRRGGAEETRDFDKSIALGSLRGGQGVTVTGWTENPDSATYEKGTRVTCPEWVVRAAYETRFRGWAGWFFVNPLGPSVCFFGPLVIALMIPIISFLVKTFQQRSSITMAGNNGTTVKEGARVHNGKEKGQ